ncbi:MAG: MBL fold metallo-hydrolase [Deltaproteobacteria bacterium]|nr:MBL fold metallo-hydrolase [Deltaproteobacteria bacterium]
MVINKPGNITDRIVMLGKKESNVYILKGEDEYVLIGGGMIHIIPDMIEQIKQLGIEEKKIKRIFILHAHFDHCGIVPYFKKRWPWVSVTASRRAKEILSNHKVMGSITFMNQVLIEQYGLKKKAESLGFLSNMIEIETTVGDGDVLSCGGLSLEILEVPGHSSCSIAVYVPEEKAMFASDAGGIPFGDKIMTSANSNFDKYQESLKKMAPYEIDVYLAEHFGARMGEEGRNYLKRSMESADEFRAVLEESLRRNKDVNKSTEEITDRLIVEAPKDFLPRDVLLIVVGQMLKFLSKT